LSIGSITAAETVSNRGISTTGRISAI